jgi:hypothetical protein
MRGTDAEFPLARLPAASARGAPGVPYRRSAPKKTEDFNVSIHCRRLQPFEETGRYSSAERTATWLLSTITKPDPLVVFCICAIGLAVTFAALAAFPDFSSAMAQIGNLY